jgi:hypothetical protein
VHFLKHSVHAMQHGVHVMHHSVHVVKHTGTLLVHMLCLHVDMLRADLACLSEESFTYLAKKLCLAGWWCLCRHIDVALCMTCNACCVRNSLLCMKQL